jgi:uncharacterized damage-inducible protein DinB
MTTAITMEEMLSWSDEVTCKWLQFFGENPAVLELPCGIYGTANILGLVKHIVVVELRHSQRLAGLPVSSYDDVHGDNLEILANLHKETVAHFKRLLADPTQDWAEVLEFKTLTAGTLRSSRRKLLGHTLMHSIRHWAQIATLTRAAGFHSEIAGDLLLSSALL